MALLPEETDRRRLKQVPLWGLFWTLICGVFFLGLFLTKQPHIQKWVSGNAVHAKSNREVFGFAPYWKLSKLASIDWKTLTTFAYFSLPVASDGTIDKTSYEWSVFEGKTLEDLFKKAKSNNVRRVVTLTMMEADSVEAFLDNPSAWDRVAAQSAEIINSQGLEGVNIDFEYIPANATLRKNFGDFFETYSRKLRQDSQNPYITVSVLASSERFDRIYDISRLAKTADGIFMMAYDFYYPGSETAGPSAPLYGYNDGRGPFWYDVATAVDDFLKVAPSNKIIMGVPYYGWNYPTALAVPNSERTSWLRAFATTNEKAANDKLLAVTPIGGWDSQAQVAWRGYWDGNSWHVVYMEDEKSLAAKYDFARSRNLKGVGIWALGFDNDNERFWSLLASKFAGQNLAWRPTKSWIF